MITAVVPVKSVESVKRALDALDTPLVDAVELRLDYLADANSILEAIRLAAELGVLEKAIVTIRAWWEGGVNRIPDEERVELLKAALDHGAMLVDLEVLTLERVESGRLEGLDWGRVLLSLHTPLEELGDGQAEYLLREARSLGAWGAKLAVKAGDPVRAAERLYWFLSEALRLGVRAAAMPYGCCKSLRLALYAAGSAILYVCAKGDIGGTAEGQPCLESDTDRSMVECAKRLHERSLKA